MRKKSLFLILFIILGTLFIAWSYVKYIQKEKGQLEDDIYKNEARFMQKNLASMIDEKKKSTMAIALTLAANNSLPEFLKNKKELRYKLNNLILNFKEHTNYKNIWIHILDKNAHSLYRSWTKLSDDTFCATREDLQYVLKHKTVLSTISVDIFSINIKAIVPLYSSQHKFIGLIEVISHFNSISKGLKKLGIDSVVVADIENSKHIKYPFTKMYIEKCYIANFDAPQILQEYLKKNHLKQYCKAENIVENDYIIASYLLKDYDGHKVGYYIMFKNIDKVSKTDLNFFLFRWSVFAILFLMALAGVINITLYYILKKQKSYYKKILDSSSNIVLVNDKKNIIDANKTFFKYFKRYKTVAEFREANSCICNFFVDAEAYLDKGTVAYGWLDYVLENSDKQNKVKMNIDGKIYYFLVNVALISEEKEHYSVIFSDITEQELYKKELEKLSLHDPLTHIGNRRKYQQRLEEEIARACRYKTPLSLISFDLDHFKKVNDTKGHLIGDDVLSTYAQLVASQLRDVDEVFRIGGEEFMVIAPHITRDEAVVLAEKLRKTIEESKKIVPITASFGVTEFKVCEDEDSFLRRVDYALYQAKENGRNRVEVG